MSGLFFPRTPYVLAWGVQKYVKDVGGLGQYSYAEALWRVLVESLEEMQKKLCTGEVFNVQMNGFTLLTHVMIYVFVNVQYVFLVIAIM